MGGVSVVESAVVFEEDGDGVEFAPVFVEDGQAEALVLAECDRAGEGDPELEG